MVVNCGLQIVVNCGLQIVVNCGLQIVVTNTFIMFISEVKEFVAISEAKKYWKEHNEIICLGTDGYVYKQSERVYCNKIANKVFKHNSLKIANK